MQSMWMRRTWPLSGHSRRGTDVVRVSRIQAEALDDDAEEMPQGGQCTHLASCLFQATEIRGVSFADLVCWHQVAGGCQDGYQPRPSQPALFFSHHQFKSPPPPVPARRPGYICGSGGHDLRMEKQLKVAFHTVS